MDPLTVKTAVDAAKTALKTAGWVWDKFKKLRTDFSIFWKHFERQASREEHDVPWDQLKRYRLDPEFIGRVSVLVSKTDLAVKAEMEEMFRKDLDPIVGGRLGSKEELAE